MHGNVRLFPASYPLFVSVQQSLPYAHVIVWCTILCSQISGSVIDCVSCVRSSIQSDRSCRPARHWWTCTSIRSSSWPRSRSPATLSGIELSGTMSFHPLLHRQSDFVSSVISAPLCASLTYLSSGSLFILRVLGDRQGLSAAPSRRDQTGHHQDLFQL